MASKAHALIYLLRILLVLMFVVMLLTLFMYSPFYAKGALWLLNRLTDVAVDPVAAQSQKNGSLNLEIHYEPGSAEWVARQAYLAEVKQALNSQKDYDFGHLLQRYELLRSVIKAQKNTPQPEDDTAIEAEHPSDHPIAASTDYYQQLMLNRNQPLYLQYREFLRQSQSDASAAQPAVADKAEKLAEEEIKQPLVLQRPDHQPHAIVVLGGGLTAGEKKGQIVPNAYTVKRLATAVDLYHKYQLPIVLSGVEAPYMQSWLQARHIEAKFLENRSMNTCENTRFSALLLQKQGGAPTVFLVTDAYHMPRARQLFARNGINSIPVNAPLPTALSQWQPSQINWVHSRRANYEILALIRSRWIGESNCREVP